MKKNYHISYTSPTIQFHPYVSMAVSEEKIATTYIPTETTITIDGIPIGDIYREGDIYFKFDLATSPTKPKSQTTHTFSAELPSGEVVEMPEPDGDGWKIIEREEFKRGDMRLQETNVNHKNWDNYQKAWWHDYHMILRQKTPILSIITWRREIQPEPPVEQPYEYHCASKQPLRGNWPEYINELD